MALLQSLAIQRVRDVLQDNPWQTRPVEAADTTGTITVPDTTRWDEGAIIEFQDNGEQGWVRSITNATTMNILRGINGTTATTHSSATVYRDPVFRYSVIKDSIELTIQSLFPYAYKKISLAIAYDSTRTFYDTAIDLVEVIQVSQPRTQPSKIYVYGAGSSPVVKNLPTSVVTSGIGIAFPNGWATTTTNIQLDYAAKLTTTQTTAGTYSDISDGLLAEVITYGAAARLAVNTEIPRVTQEDIGMGDSSVTPGARARAGSYLQQIFLDKRRLYQQELFRTMPLRPNDQANPLQVGRISGYYGTQPPYA